MTLREYYNKLQSIDLQKAKEDAVLANKDVIISLNQGQIRLGRTMKDENIEPYYSDLYLKRKLKMSSYVAPAGIPDLYLTGAFVGAMDVIVDNGEYFLTSWDEKNGFLTNRYADIFGLTNDRRN